MSAATSPSVGYGEYKVGWICALASELIAAMSMLDEEYGDPDSRHKSDDNKYVLGRVGKYKVVIASLPSGQPGTHNAAIVAAQMKYTFYNIEFFLMVGIAGGIPSDHDVRLGDVVVSNPGKDNMGVVQTDFGTVTELEFQHTHVLNGPPRHLLNVVMTVKSKHAFGNSRVSDRISAMFEKHPALVEEYAHPGLENDQLFKADYEHIGGLTCAQCDVSMLAIRLPRLDNKPKIHYGTVLSANSVMRNAVSRDVLGKKYDALCFEMESGGLMNTFDCIVIRGICDYADSHKDKRWQAYAAVAAAAYAKEFLSYVTPKAVEG
jgi:nucleoside phosphorylase